MDDQGTIDRQRLSFGSAAAEYDANRPTYPAEALRWMLGPTPVRVADVGAGTGLLTRALIALGHDVIPVEPDPGMRAQLDAATPGVQAVEGAAERIPLDDASVDAVVAGQAYHWFDRERAHPELARVIRPGGVFAPVWNQRDDDVPWLAELTRIVEGERAASSARNGERVHGDFGPWFDVPETTTFRHALPMTADRLVALIATRSYFLTAPAERQAEIRGKVRELAATLPASFTLPYVTRAYRAVRRP